MHDLACSIAGAGLPVLRFDYHGTADSAGNGEDPDRVTIWIANIGAAINLLRRETGVSEVALVGLRLGALLAACAAASRRDVSGPALLAAPNSGKTYVRELQALAHLLVAPDVRASSFDGLEIAGFRVARQTLHDLADSIGRRRRSLPRRACCSCTGTIRLQSRSRRNSTRSKR
jgi:pimeloyl-ACP methyl ester carboxylesterase